MREKILKIFNLEKMFAIWIQLYGFSYGSIFSEWIQDPDPHKMILILSTDVEYSLISISNAGTFKFESKSLIQLKLSNQAFP